MVCVLIIWHASMHDRLCCPESRYEHKNERPLIYTRVGRINQLDRLSSIIYQVLAQIHKILRHGFYN